MLFKRSDGVPEKVDAFTRFIPLIMKYRYDALVSLTQELDLAPLDDYIKKIYDEKGIRISYMHIFYSALVRTFNDMPGINQFIMGGRHYKRNDIEFSMAVKKSFDVDAEETTLKFKFRGDESPLEIKSILDKRINEEKNVLTSGKNNTDLFVKTLENTPLFLLKFIVGILKTLDKINLMPRKVIEASPFHASAFITNLGSIGLDAALHHIYDFGTVGIFASIGKRGKKIVKKNNEFTEIRTMNIGIVIDERICDGYYYAKALRVFFRYINDPQKLEN
ncbi:MAG: 2-oxo acid dehydrogenase subunit E2 [Helcococcus sp.]|nr:2-oxo acid dehydrogenase subunit E2 [Helcococcus sp.]